MAMKKSIAIPFLLAAVLSGCTFEEIANPDFEEITETTEVEIIEGGDYTINATIAKDPQPGDPDTKVALEETGDILSTKWAEGDKFSIFPESKSFLGQYELEDIKDGTTALFKGPEPEAWGVTSPESWAYAIHPHVTEGSATAISIDLSSQTGTAPHAAKAYVYAKTQLKSITKLKFSHLTSILRIEMDFKNILGNSLGKDNYTLKDITLSADNNFATSATVDITTDSPAYSNKITSNELKLTGPFRINESGKAYIYISLLPGTMAKQMTVKANIVSQYDNDIISYEGTFTGNAKTMAGKFYMATAEMTESVQRLYFVKASASPNGSGRTWDKPTSLTSALQRANQTTAVHGGTATVYIEAGTYIPTAGANFNTGAAAQNKCFYVGPGVSLQGGFPSGQTGTNTTSDNGTKPTISGNGTSYHTILVNSGGTSISLNDLNITSGNCNGSVSSSVHGIPDDCGGGGCYD